VELSFEDKEEKFEEEIIDEEEIINTQFENDLVLDFDEDEDFNDEDEDFNDEETEEYEDEDQVSDEDDMNDLFSFDVEVEEEEKTDDEQQLQVLSEPDLFVYDSTEDIEEEKESFEQQQFDLTEQEVVNEESITKDKIGLLYYIGQLFGTYILAQTDKELVVIDQHAAAERINYEKILSELEKEENFGYDLLVPINLEFAPSEMILIKENIEAINKLGIILEEFGSNNYVVRTIPTWIFRGKEKEFVEEIITHIIQGKKSTKAEFLNSLAKSLACKKSIKANEYHNQVEIEYMLDDLRNTSNPYTCPHGRPIIIKFDKYEIEKWFKRVV
jgi:DNA mismatch repair protein MutL